MSHWWRWLNRIAIVLGALVIVVYGIEAAIAISRNQIIVGHNYWHAPLYAWLQGVLAVVCAPFLFRYALRHWNDTKPPYDGGE